jgi:hypothetical protein
VHATDEPSAHALMQITRRAMLVHMDEPDLAPTEEL